MIILCLNNFLIKVLARTMKNYNLIKDVIYWEEKGRGIEVYPFLSINRFVNLDFIIFSGPMKLGED